MNRSIVMLSLAAFAACAPQDQTSDEAATEPESREVTLGPVDGLDLPPADLERVQEGEAAPDFTLMSLEGPPVTLSQYRGEANVVLVFYRGHW